MTISTATPTVTPLSSRIDGVRPFGGAINATQPSTLPGPPDAYRIHAAADMSARAVHPAEAAQATLFEAMLHVELVQLQSLVKFMTPGWAEGGTDQYRPPAAVAQLSGRLAEVCRLLKALGDRFPHDVLIGDPSERS